MRQQGKFNKRTFKGYTKQLCDRRLYLNLGNGRGHNNVFGVFESTGAAIILVGMPYLFLQIIKHSRDHLY